MMNIIFDATMLSDGFKKKGFQESVLFQTFNNLNYLLARKDFNVYLYVAPERYAEEYWLKNDIFPNAMFLHDFSSYFIVVLAKIALKLQKIDTGFVVKKILANAVVCVLRLFFSFHINEAPHLNAIKTADVFLTTTGMRPNFITKYSLNYLSLLNVNFSQGKIAERIVAEFSRKKETLNVICRVCDATNASSANKRCFQISKKDLVKKCLLSLLNNVKCYDGEIKLFFIADSCSSDLLDFIRSNFKNANTMIFEKIGNAASFCKCIELASSLPDGEQCLFLEDDYLFLHGSILNKLNYNLSWISRETDRKISIMPDDYPDRYQNGSLKTECRITPTGHFCKIDKSTCTFATYTDVVKSNKKLFMKFSKWPKVTENGSINRVWKKNPLYQPTPAWTLHCQIRSVVPMYLDFGKIENYMQDV